MTTPEASVVPTLERTTRIYEEITSAGLTAELVENPNGEPLAVKITDFIDPGEVLGSISLKKTYDDTIEGVDRRSDLRHILPISGEHVYPARFLDMVDLVVRTAANDSEGLATRLNSPTVQYDRSGFAEGQGIGLHVDYPGSNRYLDAGLKVHGLNIHYTRLGLAAVRLGLVRDFEFDERLGDPKGIAESGELSDEEYRAFLESSAAPFGDWFDLGAGDILIFQAEQHNERGMLPVMHEFITTSDLRSFDSFRPHIGDHDTVQAHRKQAAAKFDLDDLGYSF